MTRCALALALTFVLLLSPCAAPVQAIAKAAGPSDPVELSGFLDGVFAAQMQVNRVAGAAVAVVKDGQVLYTKGYGYADVKARTPVDPQKTIFRAGSVSKLFTWTAAMQLLEQGKLDLNTDVNTYLDFKIPATFPQPVTLRHLMSHTPGFEEVSKDLFKLRPEDNIPLGEYLKTHIPARVYVPGTVIAYSNYGAALAAYIVERASGMPFSQYVAKYITGPLGMTRSTFVQPLPADLAEAMSGGYNYISGEYAQGVFEIIPAYPAGGFSASAGDMARFMIAHLQNGRLEDAQILKESTAIVMHSDLYSQDPALHGMAYGFFEDEVNGQRVISHGGDTTLFHSGLYLLPDEKLGIFIATNSASGSKLVDPVFNAFMDRYYPAAPGAAVTPPADFAARARLYAGEYYLSRSDFSGPTKIGRLVGALRVRTDTEGHVFLSGLGPNTYRYTEVSPGLLEADEGPSPTLVLRVRPTGEVTLLNSLPFEFIKAPWYATSSVQGLIFIGGPVLFGLTLIAWLVSFIRRLRRGMREPLGARLARGVAALFMIGFIAFLAGYMSIVANVEPILGVPRVLLSDFSDFKTVMALTPILAALGAATLIFAVLAWVRRYWSAGWRVLYTVLVLWFAAALWGLWYWNWL